MNNRRARLLKADEETKGPVIYWMNRDQRLGDSWALLFAMQAARERKAPLWVLFCLVPRFLNAGQRQYAFMLCGLQEIAGRCDATGIPFHLLAGDPVEKIPDFLSTHRASVLVTDFDPLRIKRHWRQAVAQRLTIAFYEVDAHNIVPCWLASTKQEFSARTFRMKYSRVQDDFLDPFPKVSSFATQ
jgi:deoxyribodipyrimidine photo-lyase